MINNNPLQYLSFCISVFSAKIVPMRPCDPQRIKMKNPCFPTFIRISKIQQGYMIEILIQSNLIVIHIIQIQILLSMLIILLFYYQHFYSLYLSTSLKGQKTQSQSIEKSLNSTQEEKFLYQQEIILYIFGQQMNPITIGQFQVDKQIAVGGQARIYRVFKDSRIFAIKVYQQCHHQANQLFLQQKQLVESLQHKGILQPLQYRMYQDIIMHNQQNIKRNVVIMKYMKNGDLMNNIIQYGKLNTQAILKIIKSLLHCLKYLLSREVYHCDIKPQNILLNEKFQPLLIDFGFIFSKCSSKNTHYPKQYYIAPQVKKGMTCTEKSQSFSLGVLIFVLAVGKLPFKHTKHTDANYRALLEGKHDVFWRVFEEDGKFELDSQIKSVIINLMQPNPKRRWDFSDLVESQWFNRETISEKEFLMFIEERTPKREKNSDSDFPFTDNEQTASKQISEESM